MHPNSQRYRRFMSVGKGIAMRAFSLGRLGLWLGSRPSRSSSRAIAEDEGFHELKAWRGSVVIILHVLTLCGCGYSMNHRLKAVFHDSRGIFVPVFTNQTDELGAEVVFTNALIREMISRGEVVLRSREAGALELRGFITSIAYGPTLMTVPPFKGLQPYRRLPSEVAVTVSVSVSLVDPMSERVLWTQNFSSFRRVAAPLDRTFDLDSPSSLGFYTQSLIESQYAPVARDVMRDLYDEMVESL